MRKILIDITDPFDTIPNVEELLPKEYAFADKLKAAGTLIHLFVKADKSGAMLLFNAEDIDNAKEILKGYPMYPYYQKVEYSYVEDVF